MEKSSEKSAHGSTARESRRKAVCFGEAPAAAGTTARAQYRCAPGKGKGAAPFLGSRPAASTGHGEACPWPTAKGGVASVADGSAGSAQTEPKKEESGSRPETRE